MTPGLHGSRRGVSVPDPDLRTAARFSVEALERRLLLHDDGQAWYHDPKLNAIVFPQTGLIVPITENTYGGVITNATFGNPTRVDPAVVGQWTAPTAIGGVAIDAILMPTGRVEWWDFLDTRELDVATMTNPITNNAGYEVFCSGHSFLPDGRILVAGGQADNADGVVNASIYDPVAHTWTRVPDMYQKRWYPTNTTLANGEVLVTSGRYISSYINGDPQFDVANMPQVYNPQTNTWRNLTGALRTQWLYPWMFLAPDGRVFDAGPAQGNSWLNTSGAGAWSGGQISNYGDRDYGTAVMYRPGKIMIAGGSKFSNQPPTNTAELIDLNNLNPTWSYTGAMQYGRRQTTSILLADGTVMITGGTSAPGANTAYVNNVDMSVYPAEIWNPDTGAWTTMASMAVRRQYHSTAILLPDARVLSMGGGWPIATGTLNGVPDFNHADAQIFSPPYLFKGARPTITDAPSEIKFGGHFSISTPDATHITKLSLVRLGSMTHDFNQEQRMDFLNFSANGSTLNVTSPTSMNTMPPGPYMLFAINSQGVPSVAAMMNLGATSAPAVVSAQLLPQTSNTIQLQFNKNVTSVDASDLFIRPLNGGADIFATSVNANGNTATFGFAGTIPNINYEVHLTAGSVEDQFGVPLANEFVYQHPSLFSLAADANHDRHVDALDQAILSAHLGLAGMFGDGDFNNSGTVDAADQVIFDANSHLWLPAQGVLSLPGTAGADAFRLRIESSSLLDIFAGADVVATYRAVRSAFTSIAVSGGAGDDSVLVDFGNGSPIPSAGFNFDGGTNIDTLGILGTASADTAVFGASSATFGATILSIAAIDGFSFDGRGGNDSVTASALSTTFPTTQRLNSLTLNGGSVSLPAGTGETLVTKLLSISGGSTLDLNDNSMILDYSGASQLQPIQLLINAARSGGSWLGVGITSSSAKNNVPKRNTTLGAVEALSYKSIYGAAALFYNEPIDNTSVLIKYAYYGDANFSGRVDGADYARIDATFNQEHTAGDISGWLNGDFNGDGKVDGADYGLIDGGFNSQGSPLFPPDTPPIGNGLPVGGQDISRH